MTPTHISSFVNLSLAPTINTILLDLDNTCYPYEQSHQAGLINLQTEFEKITGHIPEFTSLYKRAQEQVKARISTHASSHSRLLYAQAMFELLGRTDGHIHALALERAYWDEFIRTMTKTEGLDEFLAECRRNGKKVVVVSDLTAAIQCKKLQSLEISHLIDFLVTAEEAGADKPDSRPFLLALEKSGSTPEEAVMIGDSQEKDIAGAQALGIPHILFTHEASTLKTTLR